MGQCCNLGLNAVCGGQIGPRRRDQRACAVWQDEDQLQPTTAMSTAVHFQRLANEGMRATHDGYTFWAVSELVVMGSMSCSPSIGSTTIA